MTDVSGTEFVIMHCARCGSQVAMKLDAERNVTDQWILPMRPEHRLQVANTNMPVEFVSCAFVPAP
jgi:hypothetical protein